MGNFTGMGNFMVQGFQGKNFAGLCKINVKACANYNILIETVSQVWSIWEVVICSVESVLSFRETLCIVTYSITIC